MATQIDEVILSAAGDQWTKVAMVIARAADVFRGDLPPDERCELISKHIETLVADGRLAARGDITNWRHSEIRLVSASFDSQRPLR